VGRWLTDAHSPRPPLLRVVGAELCGSYARAGGLVVPSLIDPWGLVVNEAMASGLPVLVSRGCGCARTLVRDGENGWTFEPGDHEAIAGLMTRLSSLPWEQRERMGRCSREIVADWGLERFVKGVQQALGWSRRPPASSLSNLVAKTWKGHIRTT
jgi:glycosyltransferase involved in cell wall biosynthesis